jgi:hypothetical protein
MTLLLVAMCTSCLLWVLALSEGESRADLDLPRKEPVSGWSEAAKLASIDTFEPTYLPQGAGEPELTVRGIPGDGSRPLAAEYRGSLVLRQAHVDIAPGLEDEPAKVSGADEAWWGTAQETKHLYVRKGATLIILSGHASDELIRVAGSLRSVDDG